MSKKHFLTDNYKNLKFGEHVIDDFFYPRAKYLTDNYVSALGGIVGTKSFYAATYLVSQDDIKSKDFLCKIKESFDIITRQNNYVLILFVMDEDGRTVIPQNDDKHYYDLADIERLINSFKLTECYNPVDNNSYYIYDKNKSYEIHKKYCEIPNVEKLFDQEFSYKSFIGPIVKLCFGFNPVSEYDFVNQYFDYAESNKNGFIIDRGLTRFEVMEMATRFQRRVCEVTQTPITHEDAFHYIMWNIINFAFNGFEAEKAYSEVLYKEGYITTKADDNLDKKFGVDIIVKENNEKTFFVQVKPISFLGVDKKKEREDAYEKYNKTLKEYKLKTYYAIYTRDDDGKIIWKKNNETGKTLFDASILTKY